MAGAGVSEGVGVRRGAAVEVANSCGLAAGASLGVDVAAAVGRPGDATGAIIDERGTGPTGLLTTGGGKGVALGTRVGVGERAPIVVLVALGGGLGVLVNCRVAVAGSVGYEVGLGYGVIVGYRVAVGVHVDVGGGGEPGVLVPVIWSSGTMRPPLGEADPAAAP
jgi:hypothetical protein